MKKTTNVGEKDTDRVTLPPISSIIHEILIPFVWRSRLGLLRNFHPGKQILG